MVLRYVKIKNLALLVTFLVMSPAAPVRADKNDPQSVPCVTAFSNFAEKKFAENLADYEAGLTVKAVSAEEFEAGWLRTTRHDLTTEERHFRVLIKERDPQISFLRELGFKFDYVNGHTIPAMKAMTKKYLSLMSTFVEDGRIRSDQVLKPARMFQVTANGKTEIIAVEVGKNPPKGAELLTKVATGEEFLRFVASGHWPVGELRRADENHISHALHDFGHLGGFYRNPEFMAAISDFAKARVADGQFGNRETLVNHIFESLALGRTSARPQFQRTLESVGLSANEASPLSVDRVLRQTEKLSDAALRDKISSAYATRIEMVEDIGGLRADGTAKLRALQAFGLTAEPSTLLENPRSFIELAHDAKSPEEKRRYFARYLAAMDHTTRMRPADWVRELIKRENYAPTSSIYNYVCRSGVFEAGDAYFEAICH